METGGGAVGTRKREGIITLLSIKEEEENFPFILTRLLLT